MKDVRVVVKLQAPHTDPEYYTFNWSLQGAPVPMIGDEIAFGDCLLVIRTRRFTVHHFLEEPQVVLHAGIAGRRARTPISRAEFNDIMRPYLHHIEVLG